MIWGLLELGMNLDWVTPIVAGIQDLANEGGHTFVLPEMHMSVTMQEVCWTLNAYGIPHWGVILVDGYWMVTVHPDVAWWTQYIIRALGCWIEYGVVQ